MGDKFANIYKNMFLGQVEKGEQTMKGKDKNAQKWKKGKRSTILSFKKAMDASPPIHLLPKPLRRWLINQKLPFSPLLLTLIWWPIA